MRSAGRAAHHHPVTALLLELISHGHARGVGPFGSDRHGRIRPVTVELNGRHLHIHRLHVQAGFGQVIEHALAHRIAILRFAAAAGQSQDQEESGGDTHNLDYNVRGAPGIMS